GMLPGYEQVVVGAGDVELGPALLAIVLAEDCRPLCIQFGALRLGEEFLVRIFGGALQRRVGFIPPDALQIGVAPGGCQRCCQGWGWGGRGWRLSVRPCDG